MSKYDSLKAFVTNLLSKQVPIDVIALQEIWSINYSELVHIPGFQPLIFTCRAGTRGGGVGFYIRDGLHFEKLANLSNFVEKSFECLSIEVQYDKKKVLFSNIYRSPNPPPHCSDHDHMTSFLDLFCRHLEDLNNLDKTAFVFLDSNINLHNIQHDHSALTYLNNVIENGFLQVITKSTRIQGQSHSLIDHILVNKNFGETDCGTLVTDISDHFINFQQLTSPTYKDDHKRITGRKFNAVNIDRFKLLIQGTDWLPVSRSNDVNEAFNIFWTEFSQLYEICFPLTTSKLNRNVHRLNEFMTTGLLISRRTKNLLHKTSLVNPSPVNIAKFRNYRNLYNTLIRKSKAKYFEENLNANVKNPKKTWELLREATVITKPNKKKLIKSW
jgi:hypothetical protein